jgi:hypothetical protein
VAREQEDKAILFPFYFFLNLQSSGTNVKLVAGVSLKGRIKNMSKGYFRK